MAGGSWSSYRAAAELPDNEPGEWVCDECGTWSLAVHDGCVLVYDDEHFPPVWVNVNAETGCRCSTADLINAWEREMTPPPAPDLDTLPF